MAASASSRHTNPPEELVIVPGHRTATWIAPPLLAIVAIPTIVGLAAGTPAAGLSGAGGPSWADPRPVSACAAPLGAARRANPPSAASGRENAVSGGGAGRGEWRLTPRVSADGSLQGWELRVAARDRRAGALVLPPEAAVRGPVDGVVVVARDDGEASEIVLVSTELGCEQAVLRDDRVVRQAVLEPGDGAVLFHAVRRSDRADLGVWRLLPHAGLPAVQVLPPLGASDPILMEVGAVWSTELRIAEDGGRLAVQSCGVEACRTRIVDLETGEARRPLGRDQGPLVGLGKTHAVTFRACAGLPCPLIATNLADGMERTLSEEATGAATANVGGRLLVIASIQEHGASELVLFDPIDGSRHRVNVPADALELLPSGGSASAGAEVPAGSIAAIRDTDGPALMLNLGQLLAGSGEASR